MNAGFVILVVICWSFVAVYGYAAWRGYREIGAHAAVIPAIMFAIGLVTASLGSLFLIMVQK